MFRTPTESARGGIPGARNIPLPHLLPLAETKLSDDRTVVFTAKAAIRSAKDLRLHGRTGSGAMYSIHGVESSAESFSAASRLPRLTSTEEVRLSACSRMLLKLHGARGCVKMRRTQRSPA